jgi:hypothetical protein
MTAADVYIQTPPLLTAEEAMLVLRIGRSNVYESANRFLATGGEDGIPCVRVGRPLRFPRHALEALIGGPIPWPLVHPDEPDHDEHHLTTTDNDTPPTESTTTNTTHPPHPTNSTPQLFTT